jgi:hypothetical protein
MGNATKILSDVKAVGGTVELIPPDGLRVSAPRAIAEQVKAHKQEIIQLLSFPSFDHETFAERVAIIESNGIPRGWADGYATLCTMPRPAAYAPQRWQQLVDDGGSFLDRWGRQAAALGWRAVDVFGVNPDAPESRYDGMGLIPSLQGRSIVAITADTARIVCGKYTCLSFYRISPTGGTSVLWDMRGDTT